MKQKEVEDVFGGKEEFANADSMASKWQLTYWNFWLLAAKTYGLQLNVLPRIAMGTVRTSSSYRFEVQMSL